MSNRKLCPLKSNGIGAYPAPLTLTGLKKSLEITASPEIDWPQRLAILDVPRAAIREGEIRTARASARAAAIMTTLFQDAREVVASPFTKIHVEVAERILFFAENDRVALMRDITLPDRMIGWRDHICGEVAEIVHRNAGFVGIEIVEPINEKTPDRRVGDIIGCRVSNARRLRRGYAEIQVIHRAKQQLHVLAIIIIKPIRPSAHAIARRIKILAVGNIHLRRESHLAKTVETGDPLRGTFRATQ